VSKINTIRYIVSNCPLCPLRSSQSATITIIVLGQTVTDPNNWIYSLNKVCLWETSGIRSIWVSVILNHMIPLSGDYCNRFPGNVNLESWLISSTWTNWAASLRRIAARRRRTWRAGRNHSVAADSASCAREYHKLGGHCRAVQHLYHKDDLQNYCTVYKTILLTLYFSYFSYFILLCLIKTPGVFNYNY
jgi:hypothetical protein